MDPRTQNAAQRLHYLDALRGLAAMSVVVAHYVAEVYGQNLFKGPELGIARALDILDPGKYGVVLFFLISGFIIPNSLGATGDRIGRFCISRFFRLYPLYWLALGVVILISEFFLHAYIPRPDILANATMLQGYLGKGDILGSAWTLQIELTFYGCCVLLAARHWMRSTRACVVASVGFLLMSVVLAVGRFYLVKKLPVALPLALSLMFFGTVWRQAVLEAAPAARRAAPWLLGGIASMILPISLLAYNHDFGFHERWQLYFISYSLAILTFVVCTTRVLITWAPLVWLGEISYSIYLLHPLVAEIALKPGLGAADVRMDPMLYLAIRVAIVIPLSWLTYRFIEDPFVHVGRWVVKRVRGGYSVKVAPVPAM